MAELVTSTNALGIGDDHAPKSPMHVQQQTGHDGSTASGGAPEGVNLTAFVNTGLKRWEKLRKDWVERSSSAPPRQRHAREVDVDEVIDLVVSNRWRQQVPPSPSGASLASSSSGGSRMKGSKEKDDACFPKPVALPQMVDILVDLWEAEGLDI